MKKSSISINIKKLRKENNMSQVELAEKLHISPQAVSKWETGKSLPDMLTLKSLSEIFNVSVDYLISDDIGHSEKIKVNETPEDIKYPTTEELQSVKTIVPAVSSKSMWKSKSLVGYVSLSINFFWLLICSEFFLYEHPFMQYIILLFCYLGMIYLYSLFEARYVKQQKVFRRISVVLNIVLFLMIAYVFYQ